MFELIPLYIKVSVGTTETGKRQARFERLPGPPAEPLDSSLYELSAYQENATQRNYQPVIRVLVYWVGNGRQAEENVSDYLGRYVKKLLEADDQFRAAVAKRVEGTDWYFEGRPLR